MIPLSKTMLAIMLVIAVLNGGLIMAKEFYAHTYETDNYTFALKTKDTNDDYELDIEMKLKLRDAVSLYKAALPWGSRYSMIIIAAKLNASAEQLEQRLFIDDPGPTIITIKPGELLSGKISLRKRFPSIYDAAKKNDLIIFWSYGLKDINNASLGRVGGWLILPQTK